MERVPEEIQLLFERLGFRLLTRHENYDALGRPVKWFSLVMPKAGQGNSRSVDEIETIISRDKKDATYKLALLRTLCDKDLEIFDRKWNLSQFHFVLN